MRRTVWLGHKITLERDITCSFLIKDTIVVSHHKEGVKMSPIYKNQKTPKALQAAKVRVV